MVGGGETGNANGKTARQFSCQLLPHPPTLQQGISGCRSNHVYFVQPSIILSGWMTPNSTLGRIVREGWRGESEGRAGGGEEEGQRSREGEGGAGEEQGGGAGANTEEEVGGEAGDEWRKVGRE